MKNRIARLYCVAVSVLLLSQVAGAAEAWSNANTRIAEATTEIECKSMTQSVERRSRTIVVNNRKGLTDALFFCNCDMFNSLASFSGEIINASGQIVRKIKKSDLQKSEYNSGLSSDDYAYYYECNYPTFPFTVKYEWEMKCNKGMIGYSPFAPQQALYQGVDRAAYRITLPAGQECRYHERNTEGKDIAVKRSKTDDGKIVIEVTATNLAPIEPEQYGSSFSEIAPRVYFSPSAFRYANTEGDISTWQSYGKWQYSLLDGRDVLPEEFRAKLHAMVTHCHTDRERVHAVYNYLAANTRYVSIQLGIGGLQPIAAADVCRTGFGDCKGLTNFARAMLKELGIASTYTVISTDNERLIPDFSSADQMNHVILQVPLPADTLWLECTNPQLPFGYIHQDIAGHDALLIEPTGGRICRLPDYRTSLNTQRNNADIVLTADGAAKVAVNEVSRLFQYEDKHRITHLQPGKQIDFMRSGINLSDANISNIKIKEKKDAVPSIEIGYDISSERYGSKTGNRLFIPANIFRRGFKVPTDEKRTQPIHIDYGYVDTDSICLHLPEGFAIENAPKSMEVKSDFGCYSSKIEVKENVITVMQRLSMIKGIYAPEKYADFVAFCRLVSDSYRAKIILKRTQ